jgi:hypothetical protein
VKLQSNGEAVLLGPRPVIGEVETFLDGMDIDDPVLAGAYSASYASHSSNKPPPHGVGNHP